MKKSLNLLVTLLLFVAIAASCKKDDPKPAPSGNDNQKEQQDPPTEQKVEVTGVTLNETTLTLEIGEEKTLTATVAPENATDKAVTWSSSKTDIAIVDGSGKIKALTVGEATIIAATSNAKTATCTIIVVPPPTGTSKTIGGIECVYIPAGTFLMGSPKNEPKRNSNELQHTVTLTKGFWMSKFEITNAQYCAFLNAIKSDLEFDDDYEQYFMTTADYGKQKLAEWNKLYYDNKKNEFYVDKGYDNHPMNYVSWYGANEFAEWIGGALPTEAQWEYACRGGQEQSLPFGIDDGTKLVDGMANFAIYYPYDLAKDGAEYQINIGHNHNPVEVGTYSPNAWGLYDMHGNIAEWCFDLYNEDYYSDNQTDPTGPESGSSRVIRGGHHSKNARNCRSAYRDYDSPQLTNNYMGFRIIFPE